MDIGRAFGFVFQDPNWLKKILIGGVLLIIPIFGWLVVAGYGLRIMKNVINGSDLPLPEWDDLGGLFSDGLKVFVVTIVWAIPLAIISAILRQGNGFFFQCLTFVIDVLTAVIIAAAVPPVAASGNISDGFQVQAIFSRVTSHIGDYLIIYLLGIVLAVIAVAGLIGLCVGILFTITYVTLVQAHLASQAYLRSIGSAAPPQQAF